MRHFRRRQRGFTSHEGEWPILIVIVLIMLAIAIPQFLEMRAKQKAERLRHASPVPSAAEPAPGAGK